MDIAVLQMSRRNRIWNAGEMRDKVWKVVPLDMAISCAPQNNLSMFAEQAALFICFPAFSYPTPRRLFQRKLSFYRGVSGLDVHVRPNKYWTVISQIQPF